MRIEIETNLTWIAQGEKYLVAIFQQMLKVSFSGYNNYSQIQRGNYIHFAKDDEKRGTKLI